MDFAALPPEVNSALMYSGAGAGPLLAAASAWSGLAAELTSTATGFESVVTELTGELWLGPASLSAAAAAQPYIAWLTYTAGAAEQASVQAMASAAAYEAAFAATVPPPVIAANRAQLAALVATNFLGINTPAILATEALYMEMWAQDALAMYTYAAAAGVASALAPLEPPTPNTNPAGPVAQAAAVGAAASVSPATQSVVDLITQLPTAISQLAAPVTSALDAAGVMDILPVIDEVLGEAFIANIINSAINTTAWWVMSAIPTAIFLANTLAGSTPVVAEEIAEGAGIAAGAAAAGLAGDVEAAGVGAALGEASLVGSLSVPASWANAAPVVANAGTALAGSGWTVPEEAAAQGGVMAGMPGMAAAAKGAGVGSAPRYGFKPIVMPKQVVV